MNLFALAASIAASQAVVAIGATTALAAPAVLLVAVSTGVFAYARAK